MENRRPHTHLRILWRAVSALESAALATAATFAAILWLGIALPGLPLLPGLGSGRDRNLAISLDSALLGIQDQTGRPDAAGRQARLFSLLLPARNPLSDGLASRRLDGRPSNEPIVVALPAPVSARPAAAPPETPSHRADPADLASASVPDAPPAPPAPAPGPQAPQQSPPPAPGRPQPLPPTPAQPPATPADPPSADPSEPPAAPPPPVDGDPVPGDGGPAGSTPPADPGTTPGNGNGNGQGAGNANGNGNGYGQAEPNKGK